MLDLEPYACIFEKCPDHKVFFRDRNTWISHMKNSHTTRWICAASPAHPTMNFSFSTEDEYEAHMFEVHQGTFTQSQLTMLKKHSKVPTSVTFRSCPLCGYEPLKEDLRKHVLAMEYDEVPPEDTERLASDRITKHLASHLESIAVKALPWQDVTEDAKDESVESKHAEEGTDQSEDDSSAIHRSMSISSFHDGEQVHEQPATWRDYSEAEVWDISSPGGSYDEDWGFIPRPEYYGHDRDPVLQTLLRKLYLGTSPYAKSAGGPKLPAYLVPLDRDKNFSGRIHALNAIKESLCPDLETESSANKPPSFPRCFAVYGPGGMGKTQVAAQFVANYRHKFDAVLWVYAENSNKISQDFKDIAIGLGLISESHVDSKDLTLTRDIVKRWLVNPLKTTGTVDVPKMENASWLLVFDGVEDGGVLNDFWPYDGPGSILITSRNPHSWVASLELKPFSINEATDYLLQITGRDVTDEEKASVVAIAKRLGGLPLALAQMGGIISHKSISFSEFLRSYEERESQQELLQWSLENSRPQPSNYEHNVASVWAFDSLGKGAMLLNILSMLDPDGIPESLFTAKEAENEQDLPEIADLKTDYKLARNELLARSLVTGNKREKKLFIHRLVQDVSRARMGPYELRRVFLACVRLLSRRWPFEMFAWRHGNARWEACEELFSHIQRLKDLFPEIAPSVDSFEDYEFARLLIDAGW